ncbi:MAG: helix-turn-helix domain-containing protein, partial [Methylococcaceae bacterium]
MVMSEVEKPLIEAVLEQCGQNQCRTAEMLGLSRSTLRKKIAQYGIVPGPKSRAYYDEMQIR